MAKRNCSSTRTTPDRSCPWRTASSAWTRFTEGGSRREHAKALAASERILLLDPESVHELRDRGLLFAQTGLFARAIADLEGYLQMLPPFTSGTDVERIRKNLEMLKKFLDI